MIACMSSCHSATTVCVFSVLIVNFLVTFYPKNPRGRSRAEYVSIGTYRPRDGIRSDPVRRALLTLVNLLTIILSSGVLHHAHIDA